MTPRFYRQKYMHHELSPRLEAFSFGTILIIRLVCFYCSVVIRDGQVAMAKFVESCRTLEHRWQSLARRDEGPPRRNRGNGPVSRQYIDHYKGWL